MCQWSEDERIKLEVPAFLSSSGKKKMKKVFIDRCIVDIIKALNKAEIKTISSCCGHFKVPGEISLLDGRKLFIIGNSFYCKAHKKAWIKEIRRIVRRKHERINNCTYYCRS